MSPFFIVPISVEEGMTVSHMFAGPMRCGAPVVIGMRGTDVDSSPVAVVGYEWPERFTPHPSGAAKERQHLARFEADHTAGLGAPRYTRDPVPALPGHDPPDFIRERDGQAVGVELTQLMIEERVETHAILRSLAQWAMGQNRHRWRHLAGRIAYVAFTDPGSGGRPPRDDAILRMVIRELQSVVPVDPSYDEPPEQIDPAILHHFEGGTIVTAALSADTDSPFYRFTGFELGFAFATKIRGDDAWARAQDLVTSHDRPGVDELIMSAGAPTTTGLAFPSDSILARMVIDRATDDALTAAHIRRIYVHTWQGRGIVEITPNSVGSELVCGEIPGERSV